MLFDLSASPKLAALAPLMQSRRAVEGFFAISGCLIVASWDRTRSPRDYFMRRANRILPAYWLAIALCLAIGSLMTTLPLRMFWTNIHTWKYLFWNLRLVGAAIAVTAEPQIPSGNERRKGKMGFYHAQMARFSASPTGRFRG